MTYYFNVLTGMLLGAVAILALFMLVGITFSGVIPFHEHHKVRPWVRVCTGVVLFLLFTLAITIITYPPTPKLN
jgi:hypothetical protein